MSDTNVIEDLLSAAEDFLARCQNKGDMAQVPLNLADGRIMIVTFECPYREVTDSKGNKGKLYEPPSK